MRVILWSWMLIIISIIVQLVIIIGRLGTKIFVTTSGINNYHIWNIWNNIKIIPLLAWLTRDQLFLVEKPPYGRKVLTRGKNEEFYRRRALFLEFMYSYKSNVFTKMFPRLHAIAFKLWAPKTKNENSAKAYKKIAEMLQEWTCTVHDRGLPRIRLISNQSLVKNSKFWYAGHTWCTPVVWHQWLKRFSIRYFQFERFKVVQS